MRRTPLKRIAWNNNKKEVTCSLCNNLFLVSPCRLSVAKYCSFKCYWDSKKGKTAWNKGKKFPQVSKKMKGRKLTEETKQKLREINLGKKVSYTTRRKQSETALKNRQKNHLWKGGVYAIHQNLRKSVEYKIWREKVFTRDDFTCQNCGIRSGNGKAVTLNADHIKPFAYFPELRFSVENGRTLCICCHRKTDTFGGGAVRNYA